MCKIIRLIRLIRVQNNLVFKPPVSALAANKIRAIRAIRVRLKDRDPCAYKIQSKIRVQKLFVQFV